MHEATGEQEFVRTDLNGHTSPTILLDDLKSAIDAARDIISVFDNDTAWWRGHAKRDWFLLPQVFRADPDRPGVRLYADETALLGHFISRAPTRTYRPCPAAEDYFGWLFLAQHYGLPTRLLDWTENLLVALFFAVIDSEDEDGCLWALWPGGLNRTFGASTGLVQIRDRNVVELAKASFDPNTVCPAETIAIDGQEIDPRMLAQMSRFTLHSQEDPMEFFPTSTEYLRRYLIPRAAKSKIRAQLSGVGIRRSNLFPDLANLAVELKNSRFG